MKQLLTILLSILTFEMMAQDPFLNIVTEEIPIPEPAASTISGALGGTAHTYQVKVNIPENWELQIVYGDSFNPMTIESTTSFYQNVLGGPDAASVDPDLFGVNPELQYDSWITIGYEDVVGNSAQIFPDDATFDSWEGGGDLNINDLVGGGVFITTTGYDPQNSPNPDGNVLIAQFTSDGTVSACMNFQLRKLNPDGTLTDPPETAVFNDVCFSVSPDNIDACDADFNGSGQVTTLDLLFLLSWFGCQSNCQGDLDGDGVTFVSDILIFLTLWGDSCE